MELKGHICMPKIVRESSVTQARKGAESYRTTIPKGVVELLELERKDKIKWEVDVSEEEAKAIVRPK